MLVIIGGVWPGKAAVSTPSSIPKVVIGPPNDQELSAILAHPEQWRHAHVGAVLHSDHGFAKADDQQLKSWFQDMRHLGLRLQLEVGAIKEWSLEGEKTYRTEAPIWNRLLVLGAPLDSLAMDEPLRAARKLGKTDDYALTQTAQFVALVRKNFPALAIGDIEPFPAIPYADHLTWLTRLNKRLADNGTAPLDFYRIDPDWAAFPVRHVSWRDVASLADETRRQGVPFSLIYWASPEPAEMKHGAADPSTWGKEVATEAASFRAAGGWANQLVIESWIDQPPVALPEADPSSFIGSVLEVERAVGIAHPHRKHPK